MGFHMHLYADKHLYGRWGFVIGRVGVFNWTVINHYQTIIAFQFHNKTRKVRIQSDFVILELLFLNLPSRNEFCSNTFETSSKNWLRYTSLLFITSTILHLLLAAVIELTIEWVTMMLLTKLVAGIVQTPDQVARFGSTFSASHLCAWGENPGQCGHAALTLSHWHETLAPLSRQSRAPRHMPGNKLRKHNGHN